MFDIETVRGITLRFLYVFCIAERTIKHHRKYSSSLKKGSYSLTWLITLKSHFIVSTLYLIFALRPFLTLKTFCQLEILRVKNSFIFQPSKSCCVNNSSKFCSKVEHFLPYLVHLSFEILYQRQLKNVHYTFFCLKITLSRPQIY